MLRPTTGHLMESRHRFRSLLKVLCLVLGASACGPASPSRIDLTIINGKEPESLDPVIISGQADGRIVSALFEGLTRYDARTGGPEPGLAESWTLSEDGRVYQFRLRENLRWSTGEPLQAEDLVASWRRVLEPSSACEYANLLFAVDHAQAYAEGRLKTFQRVGIRALSPTLIEVKLNAPVPYFLDSCSFPTLAVVPTRFIKTHGDRWLVQSDIPTSGPYQLHSWRINDRIRIMKNPHYWDHDNVSMNTVDLLPTSNASTALNLYQTGQADIVWDKELIPTELIPILKERPDFHVADFLGTYFLRINTTRPPFHDSRVRQALAQAIDKNRIVERITQAGESIANHLVPPGIPGYTAPEGPGFDPAQARALLTESGFPNGQNLPPIDYLFNSSKLNEQIAVEIQSMWRRHLNLTTHLRQLEWKAYLQEQRSLNYSVSRSSWLGDYLDPQSFLDVFTSVNGNNRTGWKDSEYDALLRQAAKQLDPVERMSVLTRAEQILVSRSAPIIPLYFYVSMEYFDASRLAGIHPNIRAEHPIRAIRLAVQKDALQAAPQSLSPNPANSSTAPTR